MTDRFGISKMIMGILETRKGYKLVPKKLSEHIVSTIEHPRKSGGNYRTGTLIDYLHERKMSLVVTNRVFGEKIVLDTPEKVHYAIERGMGFFNLSDGDLTYNQNTNRNRICVCSHQVVYYNRWWRIRNGIAHGSR